MSERLLLSFSCTCLFTFSVFIFASLVCFLSLPLFPFLHYNQDFEQDVESSVSSRLVCFLNQSNRLGK